MVDEIGVDKMAVDKTGVDEPGRYPREYPSILHKCLRISIDIIALQGILAQL